MLRLLILLCIIYTVAGSAQQADHVPDQLLIQLNSKADMEDFITYFNAQENGFNLRISDTISPYCRIYLIEKVSGFSDDILLRTVAAYPSIQTAQFNHYIEQRNVPNDPLFNQQWQYLNTGANGGTPDADIDAELAWDITTGGLTPLGDTIVIAVIDDGLRNHPDILPNLWKNIHEIPGNNIDDDGNGFVDDFRGWNAYEQNDDINDTLVNGGGHGTQVAGIVGAKGDNGMGVTGVNWTVKLMIIVGGGTTESQALAAYDYVLANRKLWNDTDGAKGAFIVASNSSWGKNNGQPGDAPLWCAMYDSMGVQGVVSVAATANANIDVDQQGDLPTGCPSDYLIAVTNTTWSDTKASAAYGLQSIDLGAPGEATYTTVNLAYGTFGGTSAASPHVAGAVGLMYSSPCSALAQLAKDDPARAAKAVKTHILRGVDPIPNLAGITVTGGRLNLNGALLDIQRYCQNIGIDKPSSQAGVDIVPNPAQDWVRIIWPSQGKKISVRIYTPLGQQIWALENYSSGQAISLPGLAAGIYLIHLTDELGGSISRQMVITR